MKVEIRNDGDAPAMGTKLLIDGVEVPELFEVQVVHRAGELAHVTAVVQALDKLDVQLDADVTIAFNLYPGHSLVTETLPDGSIRYHCEPEARS